MATENRLTAVRGEGIGVWVTRVKGLSRGKKDSWIKTTVW